MNSRHPFLDDVENDGDSEGAEDSVNGETGTNACDAENPRGGINSLSNINPETQKTLKFERNAHGGRFDAFIKSDKLWAEIEMQT